MPRGDPLDWLADRGCAWATANADGDTLELPLYITRDDVHRRPEACGGHLETALGTLGETALVAATQCQGSIFAGRRPAPDRDIAARLPRLRRRPLRIPWRACRGSGRDVRGTPLRGQHGDRVTDPARADEQLGRLARNRQGLGPDQRRSRARRQPRPPASWHGSSSQRTVSLWQRPQVQALLWTLMRRLLTSSRQSSRPAH
jgi:hypothetical protein